VTPLPPIEVEPKSEPKPETKPPEPARPDIKLQAQEPVRTPVVADKPTVTAAKSADKSADKPVDKPAANKGDEVRALAALSGVATAEQWIVQLGAYKDAANVKQLLIKIKQVGMPTYTEPFDSPQGQRTRVRAGPFKTKDAAEKARVRIKKIGVDGQVAQK
jgi:DedD protein